MVAGGADVKKSMYVRTVGVSAISSYNKFMTQEPAPEYGLSTHVARVKVPQYLFPHGISLPEVAGKGESRFPLVIDYDTINPSVIGQPEFVDKHSEISQRYLETNFPEYAKLNDEERAKIAHDYSHHFVIELLVYQALAKGAAAHDVEFSFTKTLDSIADDLTFPNFLNERLAESLKKSHPMYANVNRTDLENSVSVRPIIDDDGRDSLLISVDDPESMQNDIRNGKIRDMLKERLSTMNMDQLLGIYLHNDQQHDLVRSIPLLI